MNFIWHISISVVVIVGETKQIYYGENIPMQFRGDFMFNVSHLILQSALFCGSDIICNKSLLTVFGIPNESGSGKTRCGSCSCSEDYLPPYSLQNSCPDVFFKHGLLECRDVNILSKKTFLKEVVASCPVGTSLNLSRECTKDRFNVETLLHPPVSSDTREVSYLNKYCAICNQETNGKEWNAMFECPRSVDFNFLSSYQEILNLAGQESCNILYNSPNSKGDCDNKYDGKLTSCNVTGSWLNYDEQLEQGCLSSYDAPIGIYKNIFCAMCNPPTFQEIAMIDKCDNSTSIYNDACSVLPIQEASFPYKNVFCFACNHDEDNIRYYTDIDYKSAQETYKANEKYSFQFEISFSYSENNAEQYIREMNSESNLGHLIPEPTRKEETSRNEHQLKCPIIQRNWSLVDKGFPGEQSKPYTNIEMESPVSKMSPLHMITTFPKINITNLIRMSFAFSRHGTCTPGLLPNYTIPLQKPCSCTVGCRSDCCDDFALSIPWICISDEIVGDKKGKGKKYLTVGNCTADRKIGRLCTDNNTLHFYQIFPVTARHGNRESYANFFCYLCNKNMNGIKYTNILEKATREVAVWPLKVKCSNYVNHRNFYSLQHLIEYLNQTSCVMGFVPHTDASECKDTCNYEHFNTVGRCNVSGTWSVFNIDIRNACEYSETFRFTPFQLDGRIFKNKFCAICNPFESNHTNIPCREFPENSSVVKACQEFPGVDVCFPYRNVFCEMCLNNGTESACYQGIEIDKGLTTLVPTLPTTMQPLPPEKWWTFRSTFGLGEYDDPIAVTENKHLPTCPDNQVFDDLQQICRNLTCFPGKVRKNKSCVSLLAVTSKLRYTLAVKIKISTSTVIDASVQELIKRIQGYITKKIKLQFSTNVFIEKIGLMSSVSCKKPFTAVNEVFLYLKIFVDGLVNRDEMEQKLVDFTDSSADWDLSNKRKPVWMLRVKVSRHHQSLSLPSFLRNSDETSHCFIIKDIESYRSEIHKNVYVSPLLMCPQFILKDNESGLDHVNAGGEYPFLDTPSFHYTSPSTDSGQLRKCVQAKQPMTSETDDFILTILTVISLIISLSCLFITFVTYCMFSSLRTLPGINNMFLVVSLFLAQFLMIIRPIVKSTILSIVSALSHVSWLSTFLWLQVCSFHMFRVFNAKGRSEFSGSKSKKRAKFYALYAFGSSTFIVTTNIIVSLIVTEGANSGYGNMLTLMTYKTAFIVTLIVPLILICITNIIFYMLTVYKIHSTPKLEKTSGNRIHFSVYVKLFTLTGLSWVLQIIDTFFDISVLSYFVAVLNGLQGLFIFASYICNERVLKMYQNVCCKFSDFRPPSTLSPNTDTTRM